MATHFQKDEERIMKKESRKNKNRDRKPRDLAAELYHTAEDNDAEALSRLIEAGADVNEYYETFGNFTSGKSILHVCCEKGRLECASILVDNGADINITDKWQMTPLMYAVITQYPDVISFLLTKDSNTAHAQGKHGKSALHCAVETSNPEIVELLLKSGADVNVRNDSGLTPLMVVCSDSNADLQFQSVLEVLLKFNADVNLKEFRKQQSALQFAVKGNHIQLVQSLLSAGADPNSIDRMCMTPLLNALGVLKRSYSKRADWNDCSLGVINSLISYKADLNMYDANLNPLRKAVCLNLIPAVRLFLRHGADPNIKLYNGDDIFLETIRRNHVAVLKMLIGGGCLFTLVTENSCISCFLDCYRSTSTSNVALCKTCSSDPMMLAISLRRKEMISILSKAGCNITRFMFSLGSWASTDSEITDKNGILTHLMSLCAVRSLFGSAVLTIWRSLKTNLDERLMVLPIPGVLKSAITTDKFLTV